MFVIRRLLVVFYRTGWHVERDHAERRSYGRTLGRSLDQLLGVEDTGRPELLDIEEDVLVCREVGDTTRLEQTPIPVCRIGGVHRIGRPRKTRVDIRTDAEHALHLGRVGLDRKTGDVARKEKLAFRLQEIEAEKEARGVRERLGEAIRRVIARCDRHIRA